METCWTIHSQKQFGFACTYLQNLNFHFKQLIFVYSKFLNLEYEINWIGNGVPLDEPICGFDGEYCVHKTDWSLIIFSGISLFIILIAAIFAFRSVILLELPKFALAKF